MRLFATVVIGLALTSACKKPKSDADFKKQIEADNQKFQDAAAELDGKVAKLGEIVSAARGATSPVGSPPKLDGLSLVDRVRLETLEAAMVAEDASSVADGWQRAAWKVKHRSKVVTGKPADLAPLQALQHVAVITPVAVSLPTLGTSGFTPGTFEGTIHVFDVATGENLGGAGFSAASSQEINYADYGGKYGDTPESNQQGALAYDFNTNIDAAAKAALGVP